MEKNNYYYYYNLISSQFIIHIAQLFISRNIRSRLFTSWKHVALHAFCTRLLLKKDTYWKIPIYEENSRILVVEKEM